MVRIRKPSDKVKIDGNDVEIEADAKANRDIKTIEILIDGSSREKANGAYIQKTLNITTGVHTINVKATDSAGNSGESSVTVGVNTDPIPTPTTEPVTPTISSTSSPSP